MKPSPAIHCRFCRHYYITHDARFPYGCHAMGFKGKRLPMLDVRESSGRDCQLFHAKDKPAEQQCQLSAANRRTK